MEGKGRMGVYCGLRFCLELLIKPFIPQTVDVARIRRIPGNMVWRYHKLFHARRDYVCQELICMPQRRNWTRDELMLAMNLYCTLPFGRFHTHAPEVQQLAQAIGRTPSSVAMKLCNLASLDPLHQDRGVKGLAGASKAAREIWQAFHADWENMAIESEDMRQKLEGIPTTYNDQLAPRIPLQRDVRAPHTPPSGADEGQSMVRVRYTQGFFRRSVLAAYRVRCCITGNPVPQLLVASHILPWSTFPLHRANPSNGLCLSKTHDAAFDQGLISFDKDYRLLLSGYLTSFLPDEAIRNEFVAHEGRQITLPDKFTPDQQFLEHHRKNIYRR